MYGLCTDPGKQVAPTVKPSTLILQYRSRGTDIVITLLSHKTGLIQHGNLEQYYFLLWVPISGTQKPYDSCKISNLVGRWIYVCWYVTYRKDARRLTGTSWRFCKCKFKFKYPPPSIQRPYYHAVTRECLSKLKKDRKGKTNLDDVYLFSPANMQFIVLIRKCHNPVNIQSILKISQFLR